jgi:hypothetical protein
MMGLICNLALYALKLGGDEDLLLWSPQGCNYALTLDLLCKLFREVSTSFMANMLCGNEPRRSTRASWLSGSFQGPFIPNCYATTIHYI